MNDQQPIATPMTEQAFANCKHRDFSAIAGVMYDFARTLERGLVRKDQLLEGHKEHMAQTDRELCQLQDWLGCPCESRKSYCDCGWKGYNKVTCPTCGKTTHDDGIADIAEMCRERIRDLVASEAMTEELRQQNRFLEQQIQSLQSERDKLLGYLERAGWGPCNAAACNCNGWHKVRQSRDERELEEERDKLREALEKAGWKPCGCPGHWDSHAGCKIAEALNRSKSPTQ